MADHQLSGREINAMLVQRVEDLVYHIFPAAKREGPRLCVGSLDGEPGMKLKIDTRGPKAGRWVDYGTSESDPRGKGDLLKLIQFTIAGGDMGKAFTEARRWLNIDEMDPEARARQRERAEQAAAKREQDEARDIERRRRESWPMWRDAQRLTPSSPPVLYLARRGIDFKLLGRTPGCIRYNPAVYHAELDCTTPAMVTKFNGLGGAHAATHVTHLDLTSEGWGKVPPIEIDGKMEDVAKRIYGPAWALGAHMPLWSGDARCKLADIAAGTSVHASEGIEDGLSYAMANPKARIIGAGTLGMLGQVLLPPQAGDYVILAQNDTKKRPREQYEAALAAQRARFIEQGVTRAVAEKRPPAQINDWNDWLRGDAA